MVGHNPEILAALDRSDLHAEVTVLEEPDLWLSLGHAAKAEHSPSFRRHVPVEYQQSTGYLDVLGLEEVPYDVVLPGREYAVAAAAHISDRLGLAGPSVAAAEAMCDKLELRAVTTRAGMPAPRFREVTCAEDVRAFVQLHGPCVLKPSNRHANLGVVIVSDIAEVERAWNLTTAADEGAHLADRGMAWRYMVEECMVGPEYSTETLVADGEIVFSNVTRKHTSFGPFPLELGHDVPGGSPGVDAELSAAVGQLVGATGFSSGVVHAEWILTQGGARLVESAGRLPSGRITELIEHAYGFDLVRSWVCLLAGLPCPVSSIPVRSASVAFVTAPGDGVVVAVRGVGAVSRHGAVRSVEISCSPGDRLQRRHTSWDRIGTVLVTAEPPHSSRELAVELAGEIEVEVRPMTGATE